jgi:GWxTD domain-containing protein
LAPKYRKWLSEDVAFIITKKEFREFRQLVTDDQRDQFIAEFWEHHDPRPGSNENVFKQEHYRRLAFSNEHFAAGIPGDKTDRGRIYVIFGRLTGSRPPPPHHEMLLRKTGSITISKV